MEDGFFAAGLHHLALELPPFLLGPPQLLDGGRKIQEVNRHYVGARPEVGVPDEGIQFAPGLDKSLVDLAEPLPLLGGVPGPVLGGQKRSLLGVRWVATCDLGRRPGGPPETYSSLRRGPSHAQAHLF